jgi:hypothetical protein
MQIIHSQVTFFIHMVLLLKFSFIQFQYANWSECWKLTPTITL